MKKIFVSILVALYCFATAQAVPAYRGRITFTQPDGSVIGIRLHGDEFCHWATNDAGQVVEQDEDGFYRPVDAAVHQARLQAGRMRRAAANARRRGPARAGIASGVKHFLVILVEFQDVHFTHTQAEFDALLNEVGYNVNGGTGSARDFYSDNSGGTFTPIFDVVGPTRLTETQAYYGEDEGGIQGNDACPELAVMQACNALDGDIDFSQYDNDGDGEVDLVFMYYAGKGQADSGISDTIWPHQWSIRDGAHKNLKLDGKWINNYACTNEIIGYGSLKGKLCGIGTACHEFGHAMGLPDFYDTDYDDYNDEAGGLYDYSTMCGGSYNNNGRTPPYFNMEERIMLGWLQPSAISEFSTSGTYTLTSVSNNVAYKSPTDTEGEYFLYECRSKVGWDQYIPEAGLIVYHVDKSDREVSIVDNDGRSINVSACNLWSQWETYNSINENGSHPCFYVVPAEDPTDLNYSGVKFAFPGLAYQNSFTGTSWNGVESVVQLSNIAFANNQVSFYATVPSMALNYNIIDNPGNGVYTAGSGFPLNLVTSEAQPVSAVAWYFDDEPVSGSSVTLPAGTHLVEAHLTLASGETKIVDLTIEAQ